MAAPAAPSKGEEVKSFELALENLKLKTSEEGVQFIKRDSGEVLADVNWREWRTIKTFVDTVMAIMRETRGAGI